MAAMNISDQGIALIRSFEGCRLTAYKAVSTEKYYTIGWGHYGADVRAGQSISQNEADALLLSDLQRFVKYTNTYTAQLQLNQNQFDALVSFCYNAGPGSLKKLVLGRTLKEIADHITDYTKSGGKILKGLERRRQREKELFCRESNYIAGSQSGGDGVSVRIGHASISENETVNGKKGDQTGKEVCIRTWYSKPWDYMAIHPDAAVREKHAQAVEDACTNENIGYGQGDRNSLNALAKTVGYDLSRVGKCNCDCSSLQNVAAVASGVHGAVYGSNGWTTATMKTALQKLGYKIVTDRAYLADAGYCVRGTIYVKASSHTVCGLDNGINYQKTLVKAGIITMYDNIKINPYIEPTVNVRKGSRGEGARWVQWCLWRFGLLDKSGIDGVIGLKSDAAIRTAQGRLGLVVDGIVGKNTREKFKLTVVTS